MQQINKNNLNGWAIGINLFSWIQDNIPQDGVIVELGSGTGTHELGKFYTVHCVEHNQQWVNKFNNLTYHYAPIINKWYDPSFLNHLPQNYNLLIIDGPPGDIGREGIYDYLDKFNTTIPIIIDDTHREVELRMANYLKNKLNKKSITIEDRDKKSIILI